MLHSDKRDEAEKFFKNVIEPRRRAPATDAQHAKARDELAAEDIKLARAALAEFGLDPDKLDKLVAERSKKRKELVEEGHRRALEGSADVARRLIDIAPVILPIEPIDTVIDEMLFIRTYADQGSLIDQNVAPGDNWARYRVKSNSSLWDGTGRLSFFALWENAQSEIAVVMVQPQIAINARLACDAGGSGVASWFGMKNYASGKVYARTTVWGMSGGFSSVVNETQLAIVDIEGGFFGDDGAKSIAINEVFSASGVVVPPHTYVLIEVEIFTEWHATWGASTDLDAESGSRRIEVPQILVSHVGSSMPPDPQPGMIALAVTVTPLGPGNPARVATLSWSGASGARVDIYQNGVKIADTENDGTFQVQISSGTYTFRVCETQSSVCSDNVTVTAP